MQIFLFISILLRTAILSDYQIVGDSQLAGDYHLVKSVDVEGDFYDADPMGNVYVAKDNTLKKFSNKHVQAAYYNNAFLGNIHSIDVSDPLRILIFYKDYNQIVWVDNFLSEIRSPIWLDDMGIDQVEFVCSSSQGGFWVFNSLNNQLQYFDVNLKLVHESPSLNILTGPDISPSYMIEKTRMLYLNVPGTGILVFDRFGNYSKTLPVDVPSSFQVTDRFLYYLKEGGLFSYNLHTAETATLKLPASEYEGSESGSSKSGSSGSGDSGSRPSGTGNSEKSLPKNSIKGAELQPGMLFIFTGKGYQVYRTD
jgi:hypothetical protein